MSERDENGDDTADESGGFEPAEEPTDETPAEEATADESPGREPASNTASGSPGPDEQYCSSCGEIIKKEAEICPECGVRQKPSASSGSKDRATAGILAILLGWIGAHKFYLGETGMGILYLCFFWTGIPAIVGLIEGILYLTKTDEEFQRQYVND
ncbi:TM2 domain-containing protein [Natronomonas amylolytica]|uniref:TM2 domain-containing protein n=1 Tax=Natronomonas amylolytica TaxID=3108498 RepID=UPI00300B3176